MRRLLVAIIGLLIVVPAILAVPQSKKTKTNIRAWRMAQYTNIADTQKVDTSYLNLPMHNMQDDYSMSYAWNGNLISPIQSRLYFDRLDKIDDIFGTQYQPYIITPQDVKFYNTTIPYSRLSYQHGFTTYHEEHDLEFMFTGNFNKRTNIGVTINYLNAAGHYSIQEGKLFNGSVFGSYNGKHYFIHAALTWNNLSNYENGGITDINNLASKMEPEDIPVHIKGMSGYEYISGFANHGYSITVERQHTDTIDFRDEEGHWDKRDTVIIDYIPVITFSHTFECNNSIHRYIERDSINRSYYQYTYRNPNQTHDTSNVLTIKNTLSVTFEEEFNKVLRFGATIYARNECQRFLYLVNDIYIPQYSKWNNDWDNLLNYKRGADIITNNQWTNNTFIGGSIYKHNGKWLFYDIVGDICLLGYKLGQFDVHGNINTCFKLGKDTMHLKAKAGIRNEHPSYYYTNYYSNHVKWNYNFKKEYHFNVGAEIAYPTKWIKPKIKVDFKNITNYVYYDLYGDAIQKTGNVQVFAADINCDITTPWINLENNVAVQITSKEIPLPTVTLYHNLYYHGRWFKALDTQIGLDLRYFTRYYAPILFPAIGQFSIQNDMQIGNYPMINVYANFFVRLLHLKFYVQYTHINHLFMTENTNYLAMPYYPMNPDIFRLGISWHFFR